MEIDPTIVCSLERVDWFAKCGQPFEAPIGISFRRIERMDEAFEMLTSVHWKSIKLEAQGDITGHLAKQRIDARMHWNRLIKEARDRLERSVIPKIRQHPITATAPASFVDAVSLDLVRILLESTYARFRPPLFFGHLRDCYAAGYLPCGWDGGFDEWPTGTLLVH